MLRTHKIHATPRVYFSEVKIYFLTFQILIFYLFLSELVYYFSMNLVLFSVFRFFSLQY